MVKGVMIYDSIIWNNVKKTKTEIMIGIIL